MTVDVEDYFQVSAFERYVAADSWDSMPRRVRANTERLLLLFEEKGVKATFFMLGWVAQREPGLVRDIVAAGHELASHGWSHQRVINQQPDAFREDVRRTRGTLEEISNTPVLGYRAASYSVSLDTLWALDILLEEGHRYSSSICPIRHDHYGIPGFPRFAFCLSDDGILEIPVTTTVLGGRTVPCGGGGWFRLAPYSFSRWALRRVNAEGQPAVFYLHPWEIDPRQPRIPGVDSRTRFRHYLNLARTEKRLARLLDDFSWDRMDRIFGVTAAQDGGDAVRYA
ncbi:MAG: DUF3473 domain-containing protein [Gammaproteobacteria bacterium]|nr:DUF3473 domain-containing protein [Gammaproteobacteria bacterium]